MLFPAIRDTSWRPTSSKEVYTPRMNKPAEIAQREMRTESEALKPDRESGAASNGRLLRRNEERQLQIPPYRLKRRHTDNDWLLAWQAARVADDGAVWILIALEMQSCSCKLLRAHRVREARLIMAHLDQVLRGPERMLDTLHLSASELSVMGKEFENWAMGHGVVLRYYPAGWPSHSGPLESFGRRVQRVIGEARPRTLAQLNTLLTTFLNRSAVGRLPPSIVGLPRQ